MEIGVASLKWTFGGLQFLALHSMEVSAHTHTIFFFGSHVLNFEQHKQTISTSTAQTMFRLKGRYFSTWYLTSLVYHFLHQFIEV